MATGSNARESLPNLSRKVYLLYHHLSFCDSAHGFRGLFKIMME